MNGTHLRAAALAVVVLLVAACGNEPSGPATGPPSSHELPAPTTPPPTASVVPMTPQVEAAIADLAAHLGVEPDDVTARGLEDVMWPDGSLGCPQPGMSYTQAQVPGSRLVLVAEGRAYPYHAGRSGDFSRCDRPALEPRG